jgi:hypothetical protein
LIRAGIGVHCRARGDIKSWLEIQSFSQLKLILSNLCPIYLRFAKAVYTRQISC